MEASALPTISVVVPTLDQRIYLEQALDSVLSQNYPRLELVVVDGGSNDGTRSLLERLSPRLAFWTCSPDRGHGDALNKGFEHTRGEVMGWLNADDILLPGSLLQVGRLFAEIPEMLWLTSRATSLEPSGSIVDSYPQPPWTRSRFLESADEFIQQESTFWRRTLWDLCGSRVRDHLLADDFDLWARFFRHAPLYQTRGLLGAFRHRPDQRSRRLRERYLEEVRQIVERERRVELVEPGFGESVEVAHEIRFDFDSWRFEVARDGASSSKRRDAPPFKIQLERALIDCEADRLAASSTIDELRGSLASRDGDLDERLALIERLDAALGESERDRAARLEVIERLDADLRESHSMCARLQARADQLAADLAESTRTRAHLEAELAEAARTRAHVEAELAEASRTRALLEAELAALRRSWSWRLTSPLRRATRFLRRGPGGG